MIKKIGLSLIIIYLFLNRGRPVSGVYFANNQIVLYEDGKKITDSSILVDIGTSNPVYEVCQKGICNLHQGYQSAIFYKTKKKEILSHEQWVDNWYLTRSGCEGFVKFEDDLFKAEGQDFQQTKDYEEISQKRRLIKTKEEDDVLLGELIVKRQAYMKQRFDFYDNPKCQINFNEYEQVYIENIINQALYSTKISLPGPTGIEAAECFTEPCPPGGRLGNDRMLKVDIKKGVILEEKEDSFLRSKPSISKLWEMMICLIKQLFGKSCH